MSSSPFDNSAQDALTDDVSCSVVNLLPTYPHPAERKAEITSLSCTSVGRWVTVTSLAMWGKLCTAFWTRSSVFTSPPSSSSSSSSLHLPSPGGSSWLAGAMLVVIVVIR